MTFPEQNILIEFMLRLLFVLWHFLRWGFGILAQSLQSNSETPGNHYGQKPIFSNNRSSRQKAAF
jgi:hypothetical protein